MRQSIHTYDDIIKTGNLVKSWQEFLRGKKNKKDVILFEARLMDNIFSLHEDLKNRSYTHGKYYPFNISDPKPRNIHKATVRDRLLHHAIYRILYPYFDKKFIHDSYSCRLNKGTHKAMERFKKFTHEVSKNNTKTCWILKCDVKKFFASIDHEILKDILKKHIQDQDVLWLLSQVIDSFNSNVNKFDGRPKVLTSNIGLPLGNLTSQLLVNIYMNEFDQFMKRELKVKHYIRYADDFVILQNNRIYLENILPKINQFLENKLKLQLHPDKVFIKTLASGVDFLGWVHFPYHRVLRTTTKRRMLKQIKNNPSEATKQSYRGMLKHGNGWKIKSEIENIVI